MKNKQAISTVAILPVLFFGLISSVIQAQTLETRDVATDLDTPWEILWGPDDWIWFTERKGTVKKVNPDNGNVKLIAEIKEAREMNEGGLMGMVLHPNFDDTSHVFLAYNHYNGGNNYEVKVRRYTYQQDTLVNSFTIIDDIDGASNHDGCRLVISPDRKLFITTGDAGRKFQYPQDNKSLNGKVLRLNLDGTVPADNPISGNPMWSKGHRNAQGLVLHEGIMYSSEHGPTTDDEFHIIKKGRNYGWPQVKGFCNTQSEKDFCQDSNVVEPLKAWTPTLAVCGIDFYDHSRIPEWKNSVLMTTLKASTLVQMKLNSQGNQVTNTTKYFEDQFGRLRDVMVGPNGKVYIATSNRDGRATSPFPKQKDDRIIELDSQDTGLEGEDPDWVRITPNPFHESSRVTFRQPMVHIRFKLYNYEGKLIFSETVENEQQWTLPRNNLPKGSYFLEIHIPNQEKKTVRKVLVQ